MSYRTTRFRQVATRTVIRFRTNVSGWGNVIEPDPETTLVAPLHLACLGDLIVATATAKIVQICLRRIHSGSVKAQYFRPSVLLVVGMVSSFTPTFRHRDFVNHFETSGSGRFSFRWQSPHFSESSTCSCIAGVPLQPLNNFSQNLIFRNPV
jgi:hypothetical protein